MQISACTYLYRGILFPYFSLAISIQKQEALHSPRRQTSAVTNVRNARQFSQVWNSVPQNVPEYSLCHAEPVLKISWNLFACLSVMLLSEKIGRQTDKPTDWWKNSLRRSSKVTTWSYKKDSSMHWNGEDFTICLTFMGARVVVFTCLDDFHI